MPSWVTPKWSQVDRKNVSERYAPRENGSQGLEEEKFHPLGRHEQKAQPCDFSSRRGSSVHF